MMMNGYTVPSWRSKSDTSVWCRPWRPKGNLTRAGAALHLTQSALSHQLRDIESRLATPLFLRVGKRMTLTPAGERVLQSADEILAAIGRTEDAVRSLAGAGRGLLRVSTECYTCYHWLPPLLKRYRKSHPRIDVRIEPGATSDPIAHLIDGTLDVAIVSDPVKDRRVVASKLFEDEVVAILAPSHPLAGRPYLRPEDFANETLLTYSPKEESTVYQRLLMPCGVTPHVQQVQITEAIIELVKAGHGRGGAGLVGGRACGAERNAAGRAGDPTRVPADVERRHPQGHGARAPRPRVHRPDRRAPAVPPVRAGTRRHAAGAPGRLPRPRDRRTLPWTTSTS